MGVTIPTRLLSSRLAARSLHRQVAAVRHADAAAEAVDRAIRRIWRDVLALLRRQSHYVLAHREALVLFRQLPHVARTALAQALARVYVWGQRTARANLVRELPTGHLRMATVQRALRESHEANCLSSKNTGRVRGQSGRILPNARAVTTTAPERGPTAAGSYPASLLEAGIISLWPGAAGLNSSDAAAVLRDPASREQLSDAEQRQLFADLLFPAPDRTAVDRRMERLVAPLRMQGRADLVSPDLMANVVSAGIAVGKEQREIAQDLLPLVDNVRASAARVARTWSLHVAHEAQMEAHEALGPNLVAGYQVHATLDSHTRPWHAHRSGTVYYRSPGPRQKGFDQMPRPPLEPEDPGERPAGTPRVAWH